MEKVKFGEFKVGEFFNVDTGSLAQATTLKVGTIPRITASSDNNGVSGMYAEDDRFTYTENAVTMTFLGDSFYHKGRVSLDMKVHCLTHEKMNDNIGMYISSILSKFKPYYSYGNQLSSSKLKLLKLSLPMIDSETPDWEYMDKYVKDVKARRLKIIEDFVDKELTDIIEMKVLEDVEFGEFRLDDVIDITSAKKPIHRNMIRDFDGATPYVTRTEGGNGVTGMIDYNENVEDHLNLGNVITLAMDTYVAFYQESNFFNGNKIKVATPKYNAYGKDICLFLVSSINKMFNSMSWGMGIDAEALDALRINLPMLDPETPDWDFMDNYMKRIESEKKDLIRQFVENAGGGSID